MRLLALATLSALALGTHAQAQSADVSTLTCADMATMDTDGAAMLLFWIDGFMGGQAQDPTFDLDRMGANMDAAMQMCAAQPDASVMEVLMAAENG